MLAQKATAQRAVGNKRGSKMSVEFKILWLHLAPVDSKLLSEALGENTSVTNRTALIRVFSCGSLGSCLYKGVPALCPTG